MSVSDLTNTTWLFNDVISYMSSSWSIDFISNNTNYTIIRNRYDMYIAYDSTNAYDFDQNIWVNNAYKTIAITGGTDVTNSTLISWLEANATLQDSGGGDTSPTTNKIGDLSIIKKHFGDLEVIKEVINGSVIYESVKTYTITSTITNGTYTGDTEITNTASVTISANTGYSLPSTISVSGATYTYDSSTGVVSLSSPTGNVTISATCVASYPVKSDIITMNVDGTNRKFRVLKNVSGTVYEVLGMFTLQTQFNTSGESTAFKNSNLDTYLNTTWYGTLNATAKDAIVTGTYEQRKYQTKSKSTSVNTSSYKEWFYYQNQKYSDTYVWCVFDSHTSSSGLYSGDFTSKIYTLTAYKIIEYLNPQNTIKDNNTPFNSTNVYKMVSGYTTAIDVPLADALYTNELGKIGSDGSLAYSTGYNRVTYNLNWYPLFQIDLSKISFTKN